MNPQLVNMQRIRAFGVLDCNGVFIPHSSPQGSMWRVGQKECKKVRSMVVYIFNFSIQEAVAGRSLMNSRLAWYVRPRPANLPSSCPDQKKKKKKSQRGKSGSFQRTCFFFIHNRADAHLNSTVTVCIRSAKAQARQNPSMEEGEGHKVFL